MRYRYLLLCSCNGRVKARHRKELIYQTTSLHIFLYSPLLHLYFPPAFPHSFPHLPSFLPSPPPLATISFSPSFTSSHPVPFTRHHFSLYSLCHSFPLTRRTYSHLRTLISFPPLSSARLVFLPFTHSLCTHSYPHTPVSFSPFYLTLHNTFSFHLFMSYLHSLHHFRSSANPNER